MKIDGKVISPSIWVGRIPTVARLERFVMEYVISTMPGYANEHIGQAFGIQVPMYACVRENGGPVLVEWRAPLFIVLPNPADFPDLPAFLKKEV